MSARRGAFRNLESKEESDLPVDPPTIAQHKLKTSKENFEMARVIFGRIVRKQN